MMMTSWRRSHRARRRCDVITSWRPGEKLAPVLLTLNVCLMTLSCVISAENNQAQLLPDDRQLSPGLHRFYHVVCSDSCAWRKGEGRTTWPNIVGRETMRFLLNNFISSASDRKRKKNKIKQPYNTTQTKRKASTDFRAYSLNPICQIT